MRPCLRRRPSKAQIGDFAPKWLMKHCLGAHWSKMASLKRVLAPQTCCGSRWIGTLPTEQPEGDKQIGHERSPPIAFRHRPVSVDFVFGLLSGFETK